MLCACVRGCVCAQRARPDVKSNPRSDSPARAGVTPPRRHPRAPPRHAVRRAALCAAHVARARRVAPRAPLVCCVVRACPGAVRACPGSARRLRPAAAGRGLPAPLVGPDCRPGAPGGWRLSAPQPIPPCRRQRLPPRGPGVSARVTSRARPHRVLTPLLRRVGEVGAHDAPSEQRVLLLRERFREHVRQLVACWHPLDFDRAGARTLSHRA